MIIDLPSAGSCAPEIAQLARTAWEEIARPLVDLTQLDLDAPLAERIRQATALGLQIGTVLSRFSSKKQQSTDSQVRECVQFAARNRIYVPPEFVCVDEGVSGRKSRRDGLDRVRQILDKKYAKVLLVYKVSRLFRSAYQGFQFFQEQIVDNDLRAIAVSQDIDTADSKRWKLQMQIHGIMDEALIDTIGDHVRSGAKQSHLRGCPIGAYPIGYRREEAPGESRTERGTARMRPVVDQEIAALIRKHYEWVRDGMSLREGYRRWREVNGPVDPRSTTKVMTPHSYRRMLTNPRYTGRWEFGRRRNKWNSRRNYARQVRQPDTEVVVLQSEELRIVSNELFEAVQLVLQGKELGKRGPKKRYDQSLWDLVTDCFYCGHCNVRMYRTGYRSSAMFCKEGVLCPCNVALSRQEAVEAVCEALSKVILQDTELVEAVVAETELRNSDGDESLVNELNVLESRRTKAEKLLAMLCDLNADLSSEDQQPLKQKIETTTRELGLLRRSHAELKKRIDRVATPITPERVRELLNDLSTLLNDGGAGTLGQDLIFRSAQVFRELVGGKVLVHAEVREARKRKIVRGTFRPQLLNWVAQQLERSDLANGTATDEITVWLRRPPRVDRLADRVHELIDGQGLNFQQAERQLKLEGEHIQSGNVWHSYVRYFEMHGLPVPRQPRRRGKGHQPTE